MKYALFKRNGHPLRSLMIVTDNSRVAREQLMHARAVSVSPKVSEQLMFLLKPNVRYAQITLLRCL